MTTRRERLEAKAEKRRGWAGAADARADDAYERAREIADGIPFGQPILVGHHSERGARRDQSRIESGMRTAVEEGRKADRHEEAAAGIERQLRTSIFSDDENAVEALRAKADELEAERDRMKRANADYRRENKAALAAMTPYERSQAVPYASYALTNIGARIRDARQRAARVERDQAAAAAGIRLGGRRMFAKYGGECADCGGPIEKGTEITWFRSTREAVHVSCPEEPPVQLQS